MTTLPESVRYMPDPRCIRNRFTVAEGRVVDVMVRHDKDRKRYTASATRKTIERKDGYSVENYLLGGDVIFLAAEQVARFSPKTLEAFNRTVLAALPAMVEEYPMTLGLFFKA